MRYRSPATRSRNPFGVQFAGIGKIVDGSLDLGSAHMSQTGANVLLTER